MKLIAEVKQPSCDVAALWEEHKAALKAYIRKRVPDQDDANDVLQEVLMKVYNFCMTKSGVKNIRSWLFQITHNVIVDHFRLQSRYTNAIPDVQLEDMNNAYHDAASFILPMIGFLPKEYAEPLRLSDVEGLKQAEVAERLGLSLTAAKSRIQRARQLLKAEFITCCHLKTDDKGSLINFSVKKDCKPLQQFIKSTQIDCCSD